MKNTFQNAISNFPQFISLIIQNKYQVLKPAEIKFKPFGEEQKSFEQYYTDNLLPKVQAFESNRVQAIQNMRKVSILSFIIFIAIYLLAHLLSDGLSIKTTLFLLLLAGLASYAPAYFYKQKIKSEIFPVIFNFFGGVEYSSDSRFPLDKVNNFNILPKYNASTLSDSVWGSYKDVNLELADATLEQQKDTDDNRKVEINGIDISLLWNLIFRPEPAFKGLFIMLSMNKPFLGKTIVKTDVSGVFGLFKGSNEGLQQVKLEDPLFEKKFDVYSTDQVESRYLLSTSFMERLLNLSELFDNAKIQCSFYDKNLFIMIPLQKEYFQVSSIFSPATFQEDVQTILDEMELIFQIIDVLKLHEKNRL